MLGGICDRRTAARVKGKVYKMDVRPAMMCSLEVVAPTQRQEAALKILRF